jgi:signal transduction histidine kinase
VQIAADRAKDMVAKILAFGRQTEGYQKLINLAFIIDEVLNLLRVTLPATIEIRQNLAPDTDKIIADPTQMHQVLMNLCMNAYQAMPKGGILEILLNNVKLNKRLSAKFDDLEPGSYIRLTIRDTGYGMDKKTLERIFDPFFTTKYSETGTGMGLSVVHGIVKNHNGDIIVQSEPGVGTTFQIYLPTIKSVDEALSKKSIKNKEK